MSGLSEKPSNIFLVMKNLSESRPRVTIKCITCERDESRPILSYSDGLNLCTACIIRQITKLSGSEDVFLGSIPRAEETRDPEEGSIQILREGSKPAGSSGVVESKEESIVEDGVTEQPTNKGLAETDEKSEDGEDAVDTSAVLTAVAAVTIDEGTSRDVSSYGSDDVKDSRIAVTDIVSSSIEKVSTPKSRTSNRNETTKCTACRIPTPKRAARGPEGPPILCSECHLNSIARRRSLRSRPRREEGIDRPRKSVRTPQSTKSKRKGGNNSRQAPLLDISIKGEYISIEGTSFRRFKVSTKISYASLLQICTEMFESEEKCKVEYRDEDGDYVIISNDTEVQEMFTVACELDISPIRMRVTQMTA